MLSAVREQPLGHSGQTLPPMRRSQALRRQKGEEKKSEQGPDMKTTSLCNIKVNDHRSIITCLAVLHGCENRFLVGSGDGLILCELQDSKEIKLSEQPWCLGVHTRGISSVIALNGVPGAAVSGDSGNMLVVWSKLNSDKESDVESCVEKDAHKQLPEREGKAPNLRALAELSGLRVVSGSEDGSLSIWQLVVLQSGKVEAHNLCTMPQAHGSEVTALAALADNRFVSVSRECKDNTTQVRVWNLKEEGPAVSFVRLAHEDRRMHTADVMSVARLANNRFVTACDDTSLRIWKLIEHGQGESATLSYQYDMKGHTDPVKTVIVLDDGRILSSGDDTTIRLWSSSGESESVLYGHTNKVSALAALGGYILSCSYDNTVRVWETPIVKPPKSLLHQLLKHLLGGPVELAENEQALAPAKIAHNELLPDSFWTPNEKKKAMEQAKDAPLFKSDKKPVTVYISVLELSDVDVIKGTFTCRVNLVATWKERLAIDETEKPESAHGEGKEYLKLGTVVKEIFNGKTQREFISLSGKKLAAFEEAWNARWHTDLEDLLFVYNNSAEDKKAASSVELKWGKDKDDKPEPDVTVKWSCQMQLECRELYELEHFPFDEQDLSMELRLSCKSFEDYFQIQVAAINFHKLAMDQTEWEIRPPVVFREFDRGRVLTHARTRVARFYRFYLVNVALLVIGLALLSMLSYSAEIDDLGTRIGTCLTLLLTNVAFKIVISDFLPRVSYSTLLDLLVMCGLMILCLNTFMCVLPHHLPLSSYHALNRFGGEQLNRAAVTISAILTALSIAVWCFRALYIRRIIQERNKNKSGMEGFKILEREKWHSFGFLPPDDGKSDATVVTIARQTSIVDMEAVKKVLERKHSLTQLALGSSIEVPYLTGALLGEGGLRTDYADAVAEFKAAGLDEKARAWESKEIAFPGGIGNLWSVMVEPIFTKFVEATDGKDGSPAYKCDGFNIFTNTQTAFPEAGSGGSSSGSLFHALVCPTSRVYNAVSLHGKEHVELLQRMVATTAAKVSEDPEGFVSRARAAQTQWMVGRKKAPEVVARWEAVFDKMWADFKASGEELRIGYFFHLHPQHSVGHLHMHVLPLNARLRTNLDHDEKCCAASTVIAGLLASSGDF